MNDEAAPTEVGAAHRRHRNRRPPCYRPKGVEAMPHQCAAPGCTVPAETTICRTCTADLEHLLRKLLLRVETRNGRRHRLPGLIEELTTTLARQSVHGGHGGRRSADKPMAYDVRASEAYIGLRAALTGAVTGLHGRPTRDIAAMARWLLTQVNAIAADAGAANVLKNLRTAVGRVERVIAGPVPQIPLGMCGEFDLKRDAVCPAELTVRFLDESHAQCRACGHQHKVAGRIDRVRTEASGMLLPIREIARLAAFVGEATDTARTENLINVWATRKRIVRVGTDPAGRALYRVGEVFERLRSATSAREGKAS